MADDVVFERTMDRVLRMEGGYVDDPADAGGATNFGISQRAYPGVDIRHLTREGALDIYRRDYWQNSGISLLPDGLAGAVLDLGINMGTFVAIKLLQTALVDVGASVAVDGRLGPHTLGAAASVDPMDAVAALRWRACLHYLAIVEARSSQQRFLRGWLRRACALV